MAHGELKMEQEGGIFKAKRRKFPPSHAPPSFRDILIESSSTLLAPSSLHQSPLPLTHFDPFVTGQGVALTDLDLLDT